MRKPVNILRSPKVPTDAPERSGENKVKPGGVGGAVRRVVTGTKWHPNDTESLRATTFLWETPVKQ